MFFTKVLLLLSALLHLSHGGLAEDDFIIGEIKDEHIAEKYLKRFGYYHRLTDETPSEELRLSLLRFQEFAGLRKTGKMDQATEKLMNTDRCGIADPIKFKKSNRQKRFNLQGSTWKKQQITWKLANTGRTLRKSIIVKVLRDAFNLWSVKTNLDFTQLSESDTSEPDIWVRFSRGYHGDPYPFDGRGGTLAHAFYPHTNQGLSGDVHFDDDENFTYQSTQGRNLLWVATHEIGHSLGLEHSNVREAVMYPWYTKYQPGFTLRSDDVLGIQSLYGSRRRTSTTKKPTTTTSTTTTTKRPREEPWKPIGGTKCPTSRVTAIYYNTYARLMVAITENEQLYFLRKDGSIRYGPVPLRNYIPRRKIPERITAAFDYENSGRHYTVFFAGTNFYLYQHFTFISGPHSFHRSNPLNLMLPSSVSKVDAVLTWNKNKKTYVFAQGRYWRYNHGIKRIDSGYPKEVSRGWRGLPNTIDSAYSDDFTKKTFFISGYSFFKLDDYSVTVESGYPQNVGVDLFHCRQRANSARNLIGKIKNKNKKIRGHEP